MSFESLLIHSVVIRNPGTSGPGTNEYGDPTPGAPVDVVETVRIEPFRRLDFFVEELRNRDTRVTRHRLFAKPTSTITALSTVIWEGREYVVVSRPALVPDSSGNHHFEALLELIEG